MILGKKNFLNIIKNTPLCSIDILIKVKDKYLLCLRNNKPAKNTYMVPGGRILKNEKYQNAINRILKKELNLKSLNPKFKLIGIFNHIYKNNVFGVKGINTHYFVCAIKIEYRKGVCIEKDSQHSEFKFMSKKEALINKRVHKFTKLYLKEVK